MTGTFGRKGFLLTNCLVWAGLWFAALPLLAVAADGDTPPPVVCLRTEFLPVRNDPDALPFRLVRELARQAVLIAARDELGLATRDETLDEPFPETVRDEGRDLNIKYRIDANVDDVEVTITPSFEIPDDEGEQQANQGTPTCANFDRYVSISKLATVLEPKSRSELAEALRELEFVGAAKPPDETNAPPDSVVALLNEMNFVSQYAAVRAAHGAIKEHGQSQSWMGVLVRGYAHLALLTQHHWKSDNEVFAARSLLYAERMVNAGKADVESRAHRAYAWAIVGLHADALGEMKEIEALLAAERAESSLPDWSGLIDPYCRFEREALLEVAETHRELVQIVPRLAFEHIRAYADDRWLYDGAQATAAVCPEEYGIYAALADTSKPLGVKRMGAYLGPAALSHLLPPRIAAIPDLPKELLSIATGEEEAAERPDDPDPQDAFSIVPAHLAQGLIAATESNVIAGEPSWAVLGNLIVEEQFVQAANYFAVMADATESSMAEEVAAVLPLIKNHRYARYVESCGVNSYRDTARFYDVLGDMAFADPRGNMYRMIYQMWRARDSDGEPRRGSLASWHAFYGRNFTFPGMFEAIYYLGYKWNDTPAELREMLADEFAKISPHAPQVLRLKVFLVAEPTFEQVTAWEAEAGNDPYVLVTLGQKFQALKYYNDAVRCYERSIELSPCKDAYIGVAESYRALGQEELWQPTLERFLEVESFGLEHAQVHQLIADDLIQKRDWQGAEPHARSAAETWSGSGLRLASAVYEGLGRWDESEKWIREMSISYPTYSGDEWYFWCRRTGRGKVKEARRLAQQYFAADWLRTNDEGRHSLLVFNLLEDDLWAALEDAKYLSQRYSHPEATLQNRVFHHLQLVFVAREVKETEIEKQTMIAVRKTMEELNESDPDLAHVVGFICKLLDGDDVTDDERADVDEHLQSKSIPEMRRCNHEYFIGQAFDMRGESKLAQEYYGRALLAAYHNTRTATLAGKSLALRHETSRP